MNFVSLDSWLLVLTCSAISLREMPCAVLCDKSNVMQWFQYELCFVRFLAALEVVWFVRLVNMFFIVSRYNRPDLWFVKLSQYTQRSHSNSGELGGGGTCPQFWSLFLLSFIILFLLSFIILFLLLFIILFLLSFIILFFNSVYYFIFTIIYYFILTIVYYLIFTINFSIVYYFIFTIIYYFILISFII